MISDADGSDVVHKLTVTETITMWLLVEMIDDHPFLNLLVQIFRLTILHDVITDIISSHNLGESVARNVQ